MFQTVTDNSDYNSFVSSQQADSTTALGIAGTLTFDIDQSTAVTVSYAAGDDLEAIASNIDTTAAISSANVPSSSAASLRDKSATGRVRFITRQPPAMCPPPRALLKLHLRPIAYARPLQGAHRHPAD